MIMIRTLRRDIARYNKEEEMVREHFVLSKLLFTYDRKCTSLDACSILIDVIKCPTNPKCKPPCCNIRVSLCVWVIF